MTTVTQTITTMGTAPDPLTQTPSVFSANAAAIVEDITALVPELNTWAGQVNTVAGEVNTDKLAAAQSVVDAAAEVVLAAAQVALATASAGEAATSASVAVASANFAGSWDALTGAKTVPLAVEHDGILYVLLNNIADVTASEPGVTSDWATFGTTVVETRTANTIISVLDHGKIIEITSGTFSQTFDTAANLGSGFSCSFQNSGTGVITFDPSGSELINGAATLVLPPGTIALVTCNGTAFTAKLFALSVGDHEIVVNTGNGHGSTNTAIRRFTTTQSSVGTAITYADSATLGATFTINENGLYALYYKDNLSSGHGISLNSAELTTAVSSITAANRLASGNPQSVFSVTVRLSAADIIRCHTDIGTPGETVDSNVFRIRKIGV